MENHHKKITFDLEKTGQNLYSLVERLYPICRSITGNGVRETLSIISESIPLEIHEIPSGTKVFDWEIPQEWNITDAWIKNVDGKKIIDFKKSNLHILNYSIPINKTVNLAELKDHIYTIPEHPDWIPYRTSYYNRTWGFCMSHNKLLELKEGDYEIMIDSSLESGSMTYGEYYIKGRSSEEILISCHICHPSLCNDNLSGITIATKIASYLNQIETKYSYRFLFIPATIGSITWLSLNEDKLDGIKCGLVLALLGDEGKFHYKKTRRGNTEIDRIVQKVLSNSASSFKIIDFDPYGYDERQYCSPGFNLPVGRISRSPHGEFPQYHTSADNLNFIKATKLGESFEFVLSVIKEIEKIKSYLNISPKGEPQLGRRDLFKKIGGQAEMKEIQMALLWLLNMSDGDHSLEYISEISGVEINMIEKTAKLLVKANLLLEV